MTVRDLERRGILGLFGVVAHRGVFAIDLQARDLNQGAAVYAEAEDRHRRYAASCFLAI